MGYSSRSGAIVLALLALGVTAASAQHPQTRKGFWIGFGVGYGSYGISCSGCSGLGRESSFTGHIRLGGTVRRTGWLGAIRPSERGRACVPVGISHSSIHF